ncbi:MAG: hypothetical protein H0X17_01795 [Deltaproteobacteria bacterium]|nr:hypothetical protein [Deltaproteobacteria bacterium]
MTRRAVLATAVTVGALGALSACLSLPGGEVPMCNTSADCNEGTGELCDEGICWGDPPPNPVAAVISPPSARADLVSRELSVLPIHQDGWIDDLRLEKPALYTAQLACQAPLACEGSMLGATITVTRPGSFAGGPGFRAVVTASGAEPFQLAVPASSDATYTVTIVPAGRDTATTTSPAQLLPPLRTTLTISGNTSGRVFELGGLGLPTISGVVRNELGQALPNYRLVALGRWDSTSAPTEVSTVDYTGNDGRFQLQLSAGLVGSVEVVARPVGPPLRPTLHLAGISGEAGAASVALSYPAGIGAARPVEIQVEGVGGNGEVMPVRGARVQVLARVVATTTMAPTAAASTVSASISAEGTTNDNGTATLMVLDGDAFAQSYRLSIVPPPNATMGVLYDEALSLVGPIPKLKLPNRLALRGVVYDSRGEPLKDVAVTARPSLRFVWSLDAAPQSFLTEIPPSTATTPNTGEFVVWVDAHLADTWGHYDLAFEPTTGTDAPNFTVSGIELPRLASQTAVDLPPVSLPDAAFVRGTILDHKGEPLKDAELKLFRTDDSSGALCGLVRNPPASCSVPATLIGRGVADDEGRVRLTLPRQ